ncbi:MAG: ATP synthase F1 subunit epsilon [Deltaproteobacteria bacterium]|nr:ATP synthase F1 subunit epsilon [Deltaproteobacteria bacterium]MBI5810396.1 ATP synthase F1 subunit epsilon [Deltaproteobacteria bacterium]
MAERFLLEIVTIYRKLLSEDVEEVYAPGALGVFGVLAGHTPLLTLLNAGVVTYKRGSEAGVIAIGRGYADVSHTKTTLLVESAEFAGEIDLDAAKFALSESEEALKNLLPEDPGYEAAVAARELSSARIAAKEKEKR